MHLLKTDDPANRVSYSAMLAPPEGFHLRQAVATTYSLDLEALTAVCLTLGLSEEMDSGLARNPVALLQALEKVSGKILVFCDGGQIYTPDAPGSMHLLLERMIVPVALPENHGVYPSFHPKMWLLQYENGEGQLRWRFAILSRNLTFDRSWDVALAMDSTEEFQAPEKTRPLITFLAFLRDQVTPDQTGAQERRAALEQLAEGLRDVTFSTGIHPFQTEFSIMPLGIGEESFRLEKDPLFCQEPYTRDYSFQEFAVFSPFLSPSLIRFWNDDRRTLKETSRALITRRSELPRLKRADASNFDVWVLKDEVVEGERALLDEAVLPRNQDIHAKIYLRSKKPHTDIYVGSMNATESAIHRNVELMLRFRTWRGPYSAWFFLRDLFRGEPDNPLNPFEKVEIPEEPQEVLEEDPRLDRIVRAVCRLDLRAMVTEENGLYRVAVTVSGSLPAGAISLAPFRRASAFTPLQATMVFEGLQLLELSKFYLLRVTDGETTLERVIMIPTSGLPEDREDAVVRSVIRDRRSFAEYMILMLGDPWQLARLEEADRTSSGGGSERRSAPLPGLYERMLRAALEDPARLQNMEPILRAIPDREVIPEEFRDLWRAFRRALGKEETK